MKILNRFCIEGSKDENIIKYCNAIIAVNKDSNSNVNKALKSAIDQGVYFNLRMPEKTFKPLTVYGYIEEVDNIPFFTKIATQVLKNGHILCMNSSHVSVKTISNILKMNSDFHTNVFEGFNLIYHQNLVKIDQYL